MVRFMKGLLMMGATFVGAAIAGLLLVLLVAGLVGKADASEATPTYEARLGQQERGNNYPLEGSGVIPDDLYLYIEPCEHVEVASSGGTCAQHNRRLLSLLKVIVARLIEKPEYVDVYKDTLESIQEAWCE